MHINLLHHLVSKIVKCKFKVFREPKLSNQVDEVLKNYSQTISTLSSSNSNLTGALLFSVIGSLNFIFILLFIFYNYCINVLL